MSWIDEKDNREFWSTPEERAKFNEFWDEPRRRRWADKHDEDFLVYLNFLGAHLRQEKKKPGYLRRTYREMLKDLDPVGEPVKPGFTLEELESRTTGQRKLESAKKKKEAEGNVDAERMKQWNAKMAKVMEEGELEVAEYAFKGLPVYYILERNPMFNNSDEDRAVINTDGTEVLGRLGDPKFKELFAKVKKSEKEEEQPQNSPPANTPDKRMSGECPKTPRQPNSSVRRTKTPMRGPNPKRPGWKLPRKPYGHAREVVELEDDLTDAELKKMTSELPRRCLVDAVQDWAKGHEKIVLPSITRADKAEIVATIKEHRIPVPKMSGGGYYGEDDDVSNLFCKGDQKCLEINLAGKGSAASIPRGNPPPSDDPMGEEEEEESEDEESEDDFARDIAFVCAECGQDVMWGTPEYAGRRDTDQGPVCADCAELLGIESEDEASGDDTDSGPEGADTPRRARSPDMEGGKKLSPFFHLRGSGEFDDWIENERRTTEPYEIAGAGNKADFLTQAKAYARKAGYKDWDKIKYANDGVHKLELNGVKFGRKGYGDFIEYGMKDGEKEAKKHRKSYLARATKMPGNWKGDKMSKNNLAIKVLWGGAKQPALGPNVDLVSKEESPIVEEIIEEPMDDHDIRAYYPNAKIMKYSDLKNYKTITQLLPKDKSYVFLLYQHAPNNGHWVLLMRYGKTIEFFCSYGSQIDAPLTWTNPKARQMLGEGVPYLTNLLKAQSEFNAIHNPVQYQSKGSDKATCGAHDVMRLSQMLNHGQDLTDYYDFMSRIKKESGLSYDEIVANFVSQR